MWVDRSGTIDTFGKIIDENGNVIKEDFIINETIAGEQWPGEIKVINSDSVLITYRSRGIHVSQIFSTTGIYFWRNDSFSDRTISSIDVEVVHDNEFIITWSEEMADETYTINTQRFDMHVQH